MTEPAGPADETIKVVCRVRPLNSTEEKAGSKFVLKFPSDETISCGVSVNILFSDGYFHYEFLIKDAKYAVHMRKPYSYKYFSPYIIIVMIYGRYVDTCWLNDFKKLQPKKIV